VTIFDLAFLAVALGTVIALVRSAVIGLRGNGGRALRGLRTLGLFWVVYLGVGLVFSAVRPQHFVEVGTPWCFDDWCLTLDTIAGRDTGAQVEYTATLTLSSQARRIRQRARGAWIYLVDATHRRYAAEPDSTVVPLDVELGPLATRSTSRRFLLPAERRPTGLITGHGGPYCGVMNVLVLGEAGCLFGKPAMIRLPAFPVLDRP
jgi:hypothetical protein